MRFGLIVLLAGACGACCADDFEKLSALLAPGGNIVIPAGEYQLTGDKPLPLQSGMNITAHGARFVFPKKLGGLKSPLAVLFAGENIENFRWTGGHFQGYCFDPSRSDNTWEPNASSRGIVITTKPRRGDNIAFDDVAWERLPGGVTANLTFREITSDGLCGAAITVMGAEKKGSEREIDTYARNVTIENCTLLRTGKFMWDYGYLWQITVWPEEYSVAERAMAAKYFRNDLIVPVKMKGDRVEFAQGKFSIGAVCFFGDTLPANIIRGKQYFVVENTPTFIRIAEKQGGEAIKFEGTAGPAAKMITNISATFPGLYAPTGMGPGKGAFDLVGCEKVIVRGCQLSAIGDTMHIQKSRGIIFANNHIIGSRMGAFFLAEFCQNATITGNTVDGTNGSRVVSVEKSCEDVTIVGNTFRNGGRGSWINQPKNFILADNVFVNNTTKCEPDMKRGRRSYLTGEYEKYSEVYFTTFEKNGRYGNVIVRGNIFTSGDHAQHAMSFAPGGDTILVTDNIFAGKVRDIAPIEGCENVTIRGNVERGQ